MATVMEMPKLSDTMKEGSIAKWLKKEGDKVVAGSAVVEIDTDKATMEFEAPAGGILLKILVGDGQKCNLQDPIAVIGKSDENWQEILDKFKAKKGGSSAASQLNNKETTNKQESAFSQNQARASSSVAGTQHLISEKLKASPLAKKIASDKGINLAHIQGSGPNGRIVQRDLESAQNSASSASSAMSYTSTQNFVTSNVIKIPLTNMRKTIATRLKESVHNSPHFYLSVRITMDTILNWRKLALAKVTNDQKFSINDLMIFVLARALKKHPEINSSWQDDHIAQYTDVHMSVAVALPNGLMTPVVKHADKLNIFQIASETKRLVQLAKDGKLQPTDYAGGTFSISNLGSMGIENFTAIINPPQAAILAVGNTIPTPVVDPKGQIVVQQLMQVTLSCDHRVIDGAMGAEFLKTLKSYLEDPISMSFL